MAKITLQSVLSGFNLSKINANFTAIATALNSKVLWRDNPTGEPNTMLQDLDMNGKTILNLGSLSVTGIDILQRATDAETAAQAAAASAAGADASEAQAGAYASQAAGSQVAAASSASDALSYKNTATTQAGNAATSATAASGSATTANTHATNASNSALNAQTYMNNALSYRNTAQEWATKTASEVVAGQGYGAKKYANDAAASAVEAATQAATATTKASEASTSAANALTSRNEAQAFAASIDTSNFVRKDIANTFTADQTITAKVGVGATASYQLDVQDPALTSTTAGANIVARIRSNANGADTCVNLSDGVNFSTQYGQVGGAFYIRTQGTERLRVAYSGALGVGVIPSNWASGYNVVESNGGAVWSGSTTALRMSQNVYYNTAYKYKYAAAAANYEIASGGHKWYVAPAGVADATITFTEAMNLNNSGSLGLGSIDPSGYSTTPSAIVTRGAPTNTSHGNIAAFDSTTGGVADSGGLITLGGNDGVTAARVHAYLTGRKENATSGNTASYFAIGTRPNGGSLTERFRIGSDGAATFTGSVTASSFIGNASSATYATNVTLTNDTTTNATHYPTFTNAATGNVGVEVSSTKLTFNPSTGTLTATAFSGPLSGNASTATTATNATNVAITNDVATNATYYPAFMTATSGNNGVRVSNTKMTFNPSTGNLSSTVITQTSDERKKKDWERLEGLLEKVVTLQKVGSFKWIENNQEAIGVSAQELEAVIPQAVYTDESGEKTVAYGAAALVLCVELTKELVALKKELGK